MAMVQRRDIKRKTWMCSASDLDHVLSAVRDCLPLSAVTMKSKINEQLDPQSAKRFWIGILTEQEEDYFIASLETAITRMKSGFWYKWSTAAQVRTKYAADLLAMLREDRAERPS